MDHKPWLERNVEYKPWKDIIPTVTVHIPSLDAGSIEEKEPININTVLLEDNKKTIEPNGNVKKMEPVIEEKIKGTTAELVEEGFVEEDLEQGQVFPLDESIEKQTIVFPLNQSVEKNSHAITSNPGLAKNKESITPNQVKKKKVAIKCNRCQALGHKMKECKAEKDINGNPIKRQKCERCGRYGHLKETCVTDTHFNGSKLTDTIYCTRCLRSGHLVNTCIAKMDKNGTILKKMKPNQEQPPVVNNPGILAAVFNHTSQEIMQEQKPLEEDAIIVETKKIPEHKIKPKKKTGICNKWKEGKCVLGDSCNFLHIGPGSDPRKKQLCTFHRNGSCMKGSSCEYSHNKKDFPCAFHFLKQTKGGCQKPDCEYSHDPLTKEQEEYFKNDQEQFERKRGLSE
ncbi:hypothetical protein HK103_004572 [Boothiomyces macroporosus]|uniref:Uncharacterized protein n=1 Tax=Boothiomyces macroporosus TaxID=261099 RepID=A0AAD5UGV0_9FUNG|nr:hypothetical protein HK103_004572 [Boothiomyces macroporosus]